MNVQKKYFIKQEERNRAKEGTKKRLYSEESVIEDLSEEVNNSAGIIIDDNIINYKTFIKILLIVT